jgi:hypothetical protein
MQDNASPALLSLSEAKTALAQLATDDAIGHLESALRSLQSLANSLQTGERLQASEQRLLERSLLRFRAELREAGILADRGLAYCQNWAEQMQPPVSYQSNGVFGNATIVSMSDDRHELSLEA